jgi:hypothetical protein
MTWNDVMGLISTVALSLPILILIVTKLAGYKTFPALAVYYSTLVAYNMLTQGYIQGSGSFTRSVGITNNLLDAPLILTFLTYFSTSARSLQRIKILIVAFIVFELVIISIYGFSIKAITIIMGPSIVLVLGFCVPFFVHQTKITIMHHKATGKALMIASLLFAYGCYSIIYLMYYLLNFRNTEDAFLVFFLVSTFSSLLMSAGIFVERKRVKKLSELKIVRKELSEIYGNDKIAAPLRPAIFDFDKEQWN